MNWKETPESESDSRFLPSAMRISKIPKEPAYIVTGAHLKPPTAEL